MKMRKNKIKKILQKNMFYKIVSILLALSSIWFIGFLFYMDLLPTKYSMILFFIIFIFDILNILLVNMKRLKKKIKKVISIFMVVVILIMTIANFYIGKTLGVLLNNGDSKYKLEHYSVIVLKNSKYDKLKDINGKKVGYFQNSTGAEDANDKLKEKVDVDFESYQTSDSLVQDLLDSKTNVIIIEDSIKNIMQEEISKFEELTKVIYSFTVKVKVETTLKEVNVTNKPFAVYISGIDTYGEISSVSRSDVNIVMVVNPKIHQVLLISIPRDYYVQLHGTTGTRDKLTHAGIYGVDMSIQTIEDLLELDINYYVKVNFTSVIDIVDALGGLDVYSEYTFTSYSGYSFKKGLNTVNGEQALDFARTRKAFADGDRQRGKNQQALIEAIIRKATDKSIITKYNSLLNAIDGKYQTNMSMKSITSLIKMQLKDMSSWNITSYSLTGSDSKDYTYTYNQLLYVMKPDEDSISEAIQMIDKVLNNEQLDTTYTNINGTSNKVSQVKVPVQNVEDSKKEIDNTKEELNNNTSDDLKKEEDNNEDETSKKDETTGENISTEEDKNNENNSSNNDSTSANENEDLDNSELAPLLPN